jgi:hypothetical protein
MENMYATKTYVHLSVSQQYPLQMTDKLFNNTFGHQTQVTGQLNHPAALVPEKYSPVLIKKAGWPSVRTSFDGMLSLCKRERRKTETETKIERERDMS